MKVKLKVLGDQATNFVKVHKGKIALVAGVGLLAAHPSFADDASGDLLGGQDATVKATFGHGSSLEKYFYIGEVIMAMFAYIKTKNPLIFVGLVLLMLATRIMYGIIG